MTSIRMQCTLAAKDANLIIKNHDEISFNFIAWTFRTRGLGGSGLFSKDIALTPSNRAHQLAPAQGFSFQYLVKSFAH